jgi:hypothetical protein
LRTWKQTLASAAAVVLVLAGTLVLPAEAAPPVRIAVVPSGGSGMEQAVVDGIIVDLQNNQGAAVSTVNPDWYVVCNIQESTDQVGGTARANGTVTIKTVDGQILNTIAVQTNKSDFSTQPGAPLNKALVQKGIQEVIAGLVERAHQPLEDAIAIEMATRDKIIAAETLADKDQYDEGIQLLMQVSPDTPHFKAVRSLIGELQMEKSALEAMQQAESQAKRGQYTAAIRTLTAVSPRSKRFKLAKQRTATYRAALARPRAVAKTRPAAAPVADNQGQLQALAAQKKALDAQRRAIEQQEAAIKSGSTKK